MRRHLMVVLFAACALLTGLAACGDDDDDEQQVVNPASAFCVARGGEVEFVDEAGGQVGYCILPDGTRVEEWEYYRQQQSGGVGMANPASVFCEEQGGKVEIVDEAGGQVGYCTLPDGTRVEEWEYFRQQSGGS